MIIILRRRDGSLSESLTCNHKTSGSNPLAVAQLPSANNPPPTATAESAEYATSRGRRIMRSSSKLRRQPQVRRTDRPPNRRTAPAQENATCGGEGSEPQDHRREPNLRLRRRDNLYLFYYSYRLFLVMIIIHTCMSELCKHGKWTLHDDDDDDDYYYYCSNMLHV